MTELGHAALRGLRAFVRGPAEGDVLDGRFELRQPIGEGAMGVVFAAWDREAKREIAVKVLRERGEHAEARFAREADALDLVSHPAIVRYIARGSAKDANELGGEECARATCTGAPYFAMERLVGCALAERLRRGPLNVLDTIALGRRIAGGLAAVHRAGLWHRDVKPSNVFLEGGEPGRARLVDFGLARGEAAGVTGNGAIVGTPGYMAPEQVRGDAATGPRADVFALGCVLFECLTGHAPFKGDTTEALFAQILVGAPPRARDLRADVPLGLEALVEQMLEKAPASRLDAHEVERELAELEALVPTLPRRGAHDGPSGSLADGTVVGGKYRIERRIGEGGMGVVFAARHAELGKRVALKLMRDGGVTDDARFLREAQAASHLESEHVARVLDVGRTDTGAPYIVMEYLSGVDLARHLAQVGPLPVETAVRYVLEVSEALAEAHALGIIHRDLKPSNLFLVTRRDGTEIVKVLDFGISKVTRPLAETSSADSAALAATMTGAASVLGSAWYMSPEQLQDSARVDARTDIWALGVVLYELVTGVRPFEGDNAAAVGARVAAGAPRRPREIAPHVPEELEALILRCLEKDRAARPGDVAELARNLAPFGASSPRPPRAAHEASSASRTGEAQPSAPRGRAVVIALGATAALALGALAASKWPREPRVDVAPPPASAPASVIAPLPAATPPLATSAAPPPTAAAPPAPVASQQVQAPADTVVPPRPAPKRAAWPAAASKSASSPPAPSAPTKATPREVDLSDPALGGR